MDPLSYKVVSHLRIDRLVFDRPRAEFTGFATNALGV